MAVALACGIGCGDDDAGGGRSPDGAAPPATVNAPTSEACANDAECEGSKTGPHCDLWRRRCVECVSRGDCGLASRCIQRMCTPDTRCDSSLDCALGAVCDTERDQCVECTSDRDCEAGFGCIARACLPRCDSDLDCTAARMLCVAGYCMKPPDDAGTGAQAGAGAAGSDGGARDGGPRGDAGPAGDAGTVNTSCAVSAAVRASQVVPTVMLVLDGSSSMEMPFVPTADPQQMPPAGPSRWSALRDALVGPSSGVVPALQSSVRFGLAVFGTAPTCPLPLGVIEPALGNANAIGAGLPPAAPGMFTPTGVALDTIVDRLPDPTTSGADPQVIVLVTDGDPNTCGVGDPFAGIPMTDYAPSIAAVQKARAKHIELLVVGLAASGSEFRNHLQQLANIAAGLDPSASPGAAAHFPEDPAALTAALRALVEAELSCDFALERGVKAGSECEGRVTLNASLLECNGENGWSLVDARHIRVKGTACVALKTSNAVLTADFPCAALQ